MFLDYLSPARWLGPSLLGGPLPVMSKTKKSQVLGTRRASHRIRLHVVDLYQVAGSAASSTLRIAIRAPSPVPDPNVPLYRRRGPKRGRGALWGSHTTVENSVK